MSKRRKPISDPEILELFADEPELLAVTDAIHATYPRPRRLSRPLLLVAAAVTLLSVAAIAWPREDGLIDSALAAVGTEPVVHSVVRRDAPRTIIVELRSGRGLTGSVEVETWYDTQTGRLRTVTRRDGVVVSDAVSLKVGVPPGAAGGEQAQLLTRSYRNALAEGHVREGERARIGSRGVIWLGPIGSDRYRVAVDEKTYEPVAFEPDGRDSRWRVVTLNSLSSQAGLFAPRQRPAHPVAGTIKSSGRIDLAAAAKFAWASWAGRRIGEYRLRAIRLQLLARRTSDGRRQSGSGLELTYGGAARVVVRVAPVPEPAYKFAEGRLTFDFHAIPKAGSVALTTPAVGEEWFGQLRFRGAYVSIAAPTRASLLAAARALRPL